MAKVTKSKSLELNLSKKIKRAESKLIKKIDKVEDAMDDIADLAFEIETDDKIAVKILKICQKYSK